MTIPEFHTLGDYPQVFDGRRLKWESTLPWWRRIRREITEDEQNILTAAIRDEQMQRYVARATRDERAGVTALLTTTAQMVQIVDERRGPGGRIKQRGAIISSGDIDEEGVAVVRAIYASMGAKLTAEQIPFEGNWTEAEKARIRGHWREIERKEALTPEQRRKEALGSFSRAEDRHLRAATPAL